MQTPGAFDTFILKSCVSFIATVATTLPRCSLDVSVMRFALQSTSRLYLIAHCVRGVEGAA